MNSNKRPTTFQMEFLGILHRILKSVAFNVFMLLVGFGIGFGYVTFTIHYYAVANSNYEFIAKIDHKIEEMANLDAEYTAKEQEMLELLKQFKLRISYDSDNNKNLLRFKTNTNSVKNIHK